MRIGFGLDVHAFKENRKLILGGLEIPYSLGLDGHSDADVLVHAINDALLGALALGDIGKLSPDTDPKYKDISSLLLMDQVYQLVLSKGYCLENLDTTIAARGPGLAPYILPMRENIAKRLNLSLDQVSIKATTTEKLGYEGRKEGITAYCVCLLKRQE